MPLTLPRSRKGRRPRIEFLCPSEDEGVVAPPVPAKKAMPGWFARLPGIDHDHLTATNNGLTVKRCVPFLDALGVGWIIPLAASVRIEIGEEGRTVKAGWEFDREMVSTHSRHQAAGNPYEPRPLMKFHNPWVVRTPPGWSCLFTPPLNRPDSVFEVLSGVVDTDVYAAPVNFPFVATGADGVHTIAQGTPIVQVIPFERAAIAGHASVRAEGEGEAALRERHLRSTIAGQGWYRGESRAARSSSRG